MILSLALSPRRTVFPLPCPNLPPNTLRSVTLNEYRAPLTLPPHPP